ncbi:MAG: coproporphyrinogen III oxidase, partial [Planctomycetota bacterium]|nr:coproporphyrinogen III oxidase [Planctomycetota bacterium]
HCAERFLLGLRLQEGIRVDELEDLQAGSGTPRSDVIGKMIDRGLMHMGCERLSLTDRGFLLADQVIGELL